MTVTPEWIRAMSIGWSSAEAGEFDQAKRCYEYADEVFKGLDLSVNPALSILRHTSGKASGFIRSLPPQEDYIVSLEFPSATDECISARGMRSTAIDYDALKENIRKYSYLMEQYHEDNMGKLMPHTMVLSTGRCGTVSLYRLLERTNHLPYHSYFFQVPATSRYEMMCQLIAGKFDRSVADMWVKTRAAEWIGAIKEDAPIVGLNHLDTIFAPVFAQCHPLSRFIYLRRDPVKVFESFYSKKQWSDTQICPLYYSFEGGFKWKRIDYDIPVMLAWYIKFTDTFSRAFGEVMGNRFIELSSDKLFAKDDNEIKKLIDFIDIDLSEEEVKRHFSIPYNQKAHKIALTKDQIALGRETFEAVYDSL